MGKPIPIYDAASPNEPVGHIDIPEPIMEERIQTEIAAIITARDNVRMQLNGLENQLYILNRLLNPIEPAPDPLPDSEEAPEDYPKGVKMDKGTI